MTAHIQSRMIIGAQCNPDTLEKIIENQPRMKGSQVTFCVFETSVGHKVVHTCWSGGKVDHETGEPSFTLPGLAAMEALCNLPFPQTVLIFAETKLGKTPLQEKIKQIILDAPEGARICFVGDLAKELDGQMGKAFNLSGEPIFLDGFNE